METEPTSPRKVFLYIAMSLDGFIADIEGNIDFLSSVEESGQDYGYSSFIESVDTVIMGRKTYDKVLTFGVGFPHSGKEAYIITHSSRPAVGSIQFYTGNLKQLIEELKISPGKNIFVDGGTEIINGLLAENLIDEMIISIIPVLLGDGVRLFNAMESSIPLKLIHTSSFPKGLVQLHYCKI